MIRAARSKISGAPTSEKFRRVNATAGFVSLSGVCKQQQQLGDSQ